MEYVLIIHEVEDYIAWKKVFDNAATIRKNAGEISYQLLRYPEDSNKIVHFSRWSSINNAKTFFESPELVKIRKEAGVKSPEFIYLDWILAIMCYRLCMHIPETNITREISELKLPRLV